MIRIGIDVGGTNTDAVAMRANKVVGYAKTPTTPGVTQGIVTALKDLLAKTKLTPGDVSGVMIGTTHFTNAVVQRRDLMPTAAVRLGLPATQCLPPMVDWPADLRDTIGGHRYLVHGGNEFDGRALSTLDDKELKQVAREIKRKSIRSVAVSAVFSPVSPEMERRAGEVLGKALEDEVFITLSHEIGRIGLLERENAAIMNACLRDLGKRTIGAFRQALTDAKIKAPLFLTQNDGTLMSAEYAERYPVLTFASGPTNSMRGAAFLSGLKEAMVIDVGGTTSDVGALTHGFPREASVAVEIGGVRTNFRMPDVLSFGLGGGSLVHSSPIKVGPVSVGYELTTKALVFGGDTLTASDIGIAAGLASFGDPSKVKKLSKKLVKDALAEMRRMVDDAVDRMLISPEPVPLIAVGGGSFLIGDQVRGLEVVKPHHYEVANAVGAAIAQISGEVDAVYALSQIPRTQAIEQAKNEAKDRAIGAGADPATVQVVDVEDVPLAYLPGNATRIRVKAVGDLRAS